MADGYFSEQARHALRTARALAHDRHHTALGPRIWSPPSWASETTSTPPGCCTPTTPPRRPSPDRAPTQPRPAVHARAGLPHRRRDAHPVRGHRAPGRGHAVGGLW
jgi:hypothetical protein